MKYRPPPDPGMAFHERRLTFMPRLATLPPLPASISLFPAADIHGAAPSAATSTEIDAAAQYSPLTCRNLLQIDGAGGCGLRGASKA